MKEKNIPHKLIQENFWEQRDKYIELNPFGTVPFLIKPPKTLIQHHFLIFNYIERVYPDESLLPQDFNKRLKVENLCFWFDEKMYNDVVRHILYQKVINFYKFKNSEADMDILSIARKNLHYHLEYINFLLSYSSWVAGDVITIADIVAASHLSVLDYLNEINWSLCPVAVREWYAIIKSRPSFLEILSEKVSGFAPPEHYKMLDF